MEKQDNYHHHHHHNSDKELVGSDGIPFSCPLSERDGGKESVQISLPDDQYTSTTAENGGGGAEVEAKLVEGLNKKSSLGLTLMISAVKLLALRKHRTQRFQPEPAAQSALVHALKGLKFVSKRTDCGVAWARVEKRFDELTSKTNGLLPRSQFGKCIGMHEKHDKEFSTRLFDALASGDIINITKADLKQFWDQITDESFDCRLEIKGLNFISKTDGGAAWARVEKRFDELTSKTNGLLPRSLFGKLCIGMHEEHDEEFSTKLFDALASLDIIKITKADLKQFWDQITNESFDCRLEIFFKMIDKDGDGRINEEEVKEIISSSASSNDLSYIKSQADEYARLMMEELDPNHRGYIEVEHLKMVLQKDPKELEKLLLQDPEQSVRGGSVSRNLSKMLTMRPKPAQDHPFKRSYRDFQYLLIDNWQRIWVMALWIGVMAGLFAYKYVQYRNRAVFEVMGHCVCMAKGAAETLKLNMALILLPMCRKTITWLWSRTNLRVAVPFSDNINFHKMIAVAVAIGSGIHGISHLACDFPRLLKASPEKYEPMKNCFGEKPTSYWQFVKGWEGVTGIVMVILMAIAFTFASPWFRRDKLKLPKPWNKLTGFNAFWYSHHLFIIVYALLIAHGIKLYLIHEWYKKTTWMYLAIPITLYAGERLTRALKSRIKAAEIREVAPYPGDVLALHMSKPQGFKYKSGQYIFVKCPALSPFEWHPFSITSAPGDELLSVHIRKLGDWTGQLQKKFPKPSSTGRSGVSSSALSRDPTIPRVLIDGPYGAPTQDYKDYEVVLLVGLGIGATPMISVLKDIINNIKDMDDNGCSILEEGGGGGGGNVPSPPPLLPKSLQNGRDKFKLRRAYFYWVTKGQGSFEWFKKVMNEIAKTDHSRVIEIHSYCSSVYEEGDARSALIDMLQSINYAKNRVDVVSGTSFRSHFAKPNWKEVYGRIARKHPKSRVGVFYCGAAGPVKELKQLASKFSHNTTTKFEFHKENF